jgi:hypothetical protein
LCLLPIVAVGIASLLSAPGWRIARTMRHRPLPSVTSASSARRST